MNIFRSLIGKVWQDPNAAEVVKISTGQLYLVRPGNIRTSRECIYNEAMATVRRVPNLEHHFQLVITRVYEDGDQELLEDEDETDVERVFLISEELEFRTGESDGEPTFLWRDLDGDVDEFYEFVAPGTNDPTRAFFETCMYRAMYERKYKRSAESTRDSDFEEFIWHPPAPKPKVNPRRKVSSKTDATPLSSAMESLSVAEGTAVKQQIPTPSPKKDTPANPMEVLISHEAELYLWDGLNEDFINQGIVMAGVMRQASSPYQYWLTASNKSGILLAHKISPDMNQRFSHKMHSLTWNHQGDDGSQNSWLFRFAEEHFGDFLQKFSECLWETLHQMPWSKLKVDEQNYAISANEDVEMLDVEDDEDEEEEVESELDPDEEASDEEEQEEDRERTAVMEGTDRNSQLTVGYKGDRSYVLRGNNIGVFNHSAENDVKYYATISKIATPKGKEFKPKHVMLHDQDTKMVLMNPSDPHALFSMDIERGKIVEEWKVHDDITVDHIAPDNKFAPTTREQTLVGASHNALFRIDPRVSGTKMVESQFKQYVSKNKFSGVATTASGKLAVASEKGDLRLFDSIGKNAKTALPPLGDPIIGVDVTADGRWIVATTKTYLLLIDTLIGEGRYQGSLGFDRSFPATAKPIPRRLQLRNEHVAYMGSISFTPAKFNQGQGQEENAIVTSSGPFVIAWDFKKVKKGHLGQYEIKKYEDLVVQDNFRFGDDKNIIVALQNNVLAVNKKNLKKPTRHSLAPEASFGSRSDIVNAPY
ncbi:putative VID27-domain-containing protein [Lyophyllum shimeji]|uniref:VID27-domain-containing protein n=1 Tax=Lyophyllum shimeji TaxID=47721 RepID=A0A9P3PDG9_LYOSH|nr:putative VID27-domain-containing protein [Lyophyllum shimeji]